MTNSGTNCSLLSTPSLGITDEDRAWDADRAVASLLSTPSLGITLNCPVVVLLDGYAFNSLSRDHL